MYISSDRLKELKNRNDDGSLRSKENTITFQEAFKRCKRYINEIDENKTVEVERSYEDKKRETIGMINDFVRSLDYKVDGFMDDDEALKKALKDEIVHYGILTDIIDPDNEDIDEVQVNSRTEIFYKEKGNQKKFKGSFKSNNEVRKIIEKLVEKGERLNAETPFINARTGEGFRLNITDPSISKDNYYSFTMRKQKKQPIDERDIIKNGTVTKNLLDLVKLFPRGRVNWATVGSTGSGKTVFNNVLLPFINPNLRSIYIENPTELRPAIRDEKTGEIINNFLQLEAKSIDNPKPNDPTMYNLLVNALRQTPDYIVPGEVRAPEEFAVALTAAQTGHNVFTTFHAEDPEDAVYRFLDAALRESQNTPAELLLRNICRAFRFIICLEKLDDGTRRVTYVSEIMGNDGLKVYINDLYKYVIDGVEEVVDERGNKSPKIIGRHIRVNAISNEFKKKLYKAGIPEERFEYFTKEPKFYRDEDTGEILLDERGNELNMEEEFEYMGKTPERDIEKLIRLNKERKEKEKRMYNK